MPPPQRNNSQYSLGRPHPQEGASQTFQQPPSYNPLSNRLHQEKHTPNQVYYFSTSSSSSSPASRPTASPSYSNIHPSSTFTQNPYTAVESHLLHDNIKPFSPPSALEKTYPSLSEHRHHRYKSPPIIKTSTEYNSTPPSSSRPPRQYKPKHYTQSSRVTQSSIDAQSPYSETPPPPFSRPSPFQKSASHSYLNSTSSRHSSPPGLNRSDDDDLFPDTLARTSQSQGSFGSSFSPLTYDLPVDFERNLFFEKQNGRAKTEDDSLDLFPEHVRESIGKGPSASIPTPQVPPEVYQTAFKGSFLGSHRISAPDTSRKSNGSNHSGEPQQAVQPHLPPQALSQESYTQHPQAVSLQTSQHITYRQPQAFKNHLNSSHDLSRPLSHNFHAEPFQEATKHSSDESAQNLQHYLDRQIALNNLKQQETTFSHYQIPPDHEWNQPASISHQSLPASDISSLNSNPPIVEAYFMESNSNQYNSADTPQAPTLNSPAILQETASEIDASGPSVEPALPVDSSIIFISSNPVFSSEPATRTVNSTTGSSAVPEAKTPTKVPNASKATNFSSILKGIRGKAMNDQKEDQHLGNSQKLAGQEENPQQIVLKTGKAESSSSALKNTPQTATSVRPPSSSNEKFIKIRHRAKSFNDSIAKTARILDPNKDAKRPQKPLSFESDTLPEEEKFEENTRPKITRKTRRFSHANDDSVEIVEENLLPINKLPPPQKPRASVTLDTFPEIEKPIPTGPKSQVAKISPSLEDTLINPSQKDTSHPANSLVPVDSVTSKNVSLNNADFSFGNPETLPSLPNNDLHSAVEPPPAQVVLEQSKKQTEKKNPPPEVQPQQTSNTSPDLETEQTAAAKEDADEKDQADLRSTPDTPKASEVKGPGTAKRMPTKKAGGLKKSPDTKKPAQAKKTATAKKAKANTPVPDPAPLDSPRSPKGLSRKPSQPPQSKSKSKTKTKTRKKLSRAPSIDVPIREEALLQDIYPDINVDENLPLFVVSSSTSEQELPDSYKKFSVCKSPIPETPLSVSKKHTEYTVSPLWTDSPINLIESPSILQYAGFTQLSKHLENRSEPTSPIPIEDDDFYIRHIPELSSALDDFSYNPKHNHQEDEDCNSSCPSFNPLFFSLAEDSESSLFPGFSHHVKVEYDMDTQDQEYLKILNHHRSILLSHSQLNDSPAPPSEISSEVFEITMTLLEVAWVNLERRIPPKLDKSLQNVPAECCPSVDHSEKLNIQQSDTTHMLPSPKLEDQSQEPCPKQDAACVDIKPSDEFHNLFEQDSCLSHDDESKCDDGQICAVCCGEDSTETNEIVFCDGCDIGVHQECYGVPFIPEGQWWCDKCLLKQKHLRNKYFSYIHHLALERRQADKQDHAVDVKQDEFPSDFNPAQTPSQGGSQDDKFAFPDFEVKCIFCPDSTGAFKPTQDGQWAHLACALWLPGVSVEDSTRMKPIVGVDKVPQSNRQYDCSLCKKADPTPPIDEACIKCSSPNCSTTFHVSCAQKSRLFMKLNPAVLPSDHQDNLEHEESSNSPHKIAFTPVCYCKLHTPKNYKLTKSLAHLTKTVGGDEAAADPLHTSSGDEALRYEFTEEDEHYLRQQHFMEHRWTTFNRNPLIPACIVAQVATGLKYFKIWGCKEFVEAMARYWALKRESRCGAALLHRLVSSKLKTTIDYSRENLIGRINSAPFSSLPENELSQELCDLSSYSLFFPKLSSSDAISKLSQTCLLLERYKKLSLLLSQWSHIVENNVVRERVGVEFAEAGLQMVIGLAKEVFNSAILPVWAMICDSDQRHNYMDLGFYADGQDDDEYWSDDHYEALGGFRVVKEKISLLQYYSVKEFQSDVDAAIHRLQHYLETHLGELQEKGKQIKARDPQLFENQNGMDKSGFEKLERQLIEEILLVAKPLRFLKKLQSLLEPAFQQAYKEERKILRRKNALKDYVLGTIFLPQVEKPVSGKRRLADKEGSQLAEKGKKSKSAWLKVTGNRTKRRKLVHDEGKGKDKKKQKF